MRQKAFSGTLIFVLAALLSACSAPEEAHESRFVDQNGNPKAWYEGLFGGPTSFSQRLEELRGYEFQVRDLTKRVALLQDELGQKQARMVQIKTELASLKKERTRVIASISLSGDVFDQAVHSYQEKNYEEALKNFETFLAVGMTDPEKAPKALLWKGLSHARLNQWKEYETSIGKLKTLYPNSQEAKLARENL